MNLVLVRQLTHSLRSPLQMVILDKKLIFRLLIAYPASARPRYNWQSVTITFELVLKMFIIIVVSGN